MKNLAIVGIIILFFCVEIGAQPSSQKSGGYYASFVDYQKSFARPDESFRKKEDTLQKQFKAKGLQWPAKYLYIRSFKYDSQLEVWVKNEINEQFKLFKSYRVCALAGTLGPKRMEGDYQVPEGFYYINEFNPRSEYYLSLGINYPNASDRILSDSIRPGSAIYIHGSCVTVGCIPLMDNQIDELYILGAHAKSLGQDYIPVHIFPIRFNVKRSINFLSNLTKDDPSLKTFSERLEEAYNYFEKYKQLPVVLINDRGDYIINASNKKNVEVVKPKKAPVVHRYRNIPKLADAVHQWPEFPGGGDAFMAYLDNLGKEMVDFLP
jgi:murein L,D-transpeptidase YafK